MLTVCLKFPHTAHVSSSVKFSVIDTPGVNEDGIKKLDLNQIITDAVDVCHYVAFTVHPQHRGEGQRKTQKAHLAHRNNIQDPNSGARHQP